MIKKSLTIAIVASFSVIFPSHAQQVPLPPGYVEDPSLSKACQGISAAVIAVSAITPAGWAGRVMGASWAAINAYEEVTGGRYSASARCEMSVQDWVNYHQENPFNYDEWIQNMCGGNPWNCPGTYNVGSPNECTTFIVCSNYSHLMYQPFSLNDLIAPFTMTAFYVDQNDWNAVPRYEWYL